MSRPKKIHYRELPVYATAYAKSRALDIETFDIYHLRLIDKGVAEIDFWTTARYWIKETNYQAQTTHPIREREGEKGYLPVTKDSLFDFFDKLFFAVDLLEEQT